MRHRVAHRKLGRKTEHRIALLRNLCTSLITHERIITTLPKAKELRPFAERVITLGKRALSADAPAALHNRLHAAARATHRGSGGARQTVQRRGRPLHRSAGRLHPNTQAWLKTRRRRRAR